MTTFDASIAATEASHLLHASYSDKVKFHNSLREAHHTADKLEKDAWIAISTAKAIIKATDATPEDVANASHKAKEAFKASEKADSKLSFLSYVDLCLCLDTYYITPKEEVNHLTNKVTSLRVNAKHITKRLQLAAIKATESTIRSDKAKLAYDAEPNHDKELWAIVEEEKCKAMEAASILSKLKADESVMNDALARASEHLQAFVARVDYDENYDDDVF